MTNYVFVLDADGKQLAPTKEQKAWYLIRKKRAVLVNKYPMVIRLNKTVPKNEICQDEVRLGIDDGGLHVGLANFCPWCGRVMEWEKDGDTN